MMKTLTINNIKLKNPLILAPMLEVTDLPYRLLCRKAGCSLAFTEMIYTSAILHVNKRTKQMMLSCREDKPLGIQLAGNSISEFKKIISKIKNYEIIDINCGCPSQRIVGSKAGAYLLNNPNKISQIIRFLKEQGFSVTAKIRLGFKKNDSLKIARIIEKAGADALSVHARFAVQSNSVPADHKLTKKIKNEIGIPLIANGDIFTPQKAAEILDFADGVMIGRAAIGNPLIFKQVLHYFKTNKILKITLKQKIALYKITLKQKIALYKEYLALSEKYKTIHLPTIKYLGVNFLKDFRGASELRKEFMGLKSVEQIKLFFENCFFQ